MGNDKKLCLSTWFSGFFGLGARKSRNMEKIKRFPYERVS